MKTVFIAYGSLTGNTEFVATQIHDLLVAKGYHVSLKNVIDANTADLERYDSILLGASTWDNAEMQHDMRPFIDELKKIESMPKPMAAFGCGDSSFAEFCAAVDELEGVMKSLKATIVAKGLKIDGDAMDEGNKEAIIRWVEEVSEKM